MPRSPSRDLSDRYSGNRGYFRTPDRLRWWKYALAWLALGGAVAWAAVDVLKPPSVPASYAHTHGPLANVHGAFNNNCSACHVAHSASDFGPLAVFKTRERWHDLTCEKCHNGPPHHASATDEAKKFHSTCSNCHHDHNGPLHSLVRLQDDHCTRCHTDLGKWHDASKSLAGTPYQNKVTSFVSDHPEFRSLDPKAQPRTLKFSHSVHMNPGQAYAPGGKEAMTVGKLRKLGGEAAAARYAPGAPDDALIQLDCASCHKLDSGRGTEAFGRLKAALGETGEPVRALLPQRPEGAYYLPVTFEVHCRSCHPLSAPDGAHVGQTIPGEVIPGFTVPHRRKPAELLGDLKAGYLKGLLATNNPALAVPPEPGGKLDTPPKLGARTLAEETDRLAAAAQRQLFSGDGCAKCHQTQGSNETLSVVPVPNRTVWLAHAKFNHASHRGATCASCHPGTGGKTISTVDAAKPEPVQILGLESCRTCHSPLSTTVTLPDGEKLPGGGVRHGCTDCHRYHHGDLPMQGRGGESWFPKEPRDIADWLKAK
jgi:hypothetical protein